MSGSGRHASAPAARFPNRLRATTTLAALVAATGILAAVAANPSSTRPTVASALATVAKANAVPVIGRLGRWPGDAPSVAAAAISATMPPVLTGADHQDCPSAAAACVDLNRHITWLQADGSVTFGPVRMEPGQPGGQHQTPRGTFWVMWKGGPSLVSNIYHEPMPWATFFASGGIAFHGGSLTAWSHGCVHLTDENAHYYNEHLPIGAEVVVF
jgi:lipoprotein-anchoring transpeptidase ErfK/SrfK